MSAPTIWKYAIAETVVLPFDGSIVHVGLDPLGVPSMWVLIPDTDAPVETRSFTVVGTGWEVPEITAHRGTWIDGSFVWHLMERPPT